MRLVKTHSKELDEWIKEHHYLKSARVVAKLRLWIIDDDGKIIGAMMWGQPTARVLDKESLLELTRMCFIDDTEPFVESRSLAMARKMIRKYMPKIKGLIAYSSTGQGHSGIVYQADNWFEFGRTKGESWKRKNRKREDKDISPKIRWLRSP